MNPFYFKEKQQFKEIPLFIILGLLQALFTWGLIQQVFAGKPWGSQPAPDSVLIGINIMVFILILLLFVTNLRTSITNNYICFRLFPLQLKRRVIHWPRVLHVQMVKYNGVNEYWGYGIKFSPGRGWSYALSGNYGIRITLRGGEKLLIGTHKPEELYKAIEMLEKEKILRVIGK